MNQLAICLRRSVLALLIVGLLTSCGSSSSDSSSSGSSGSGSGGSTNPADTFVLGNVAVGQAVSGASITLTDSLGATRTATTLSTGGYSIDVTGLTPPFVLVATGTANSNNVTLVSMIPTVDASVTNVVNITPLTTAIAAILSSDGKATDLSASKDSATIETDFTSADDYVVSLIAPTLTDAGLSSDADPVTTFFTSDGTGYDSIYDNLQVAETSQGAIMLAPSNSATSAAPLCTTATVGACNPVYSDPSDQTTTNPNQCGSDIATGAPIPCDPLLPVTSTPPGGVLPTPITVGNGAYTLGCTGCVFFGAADMPTPANPLNITAVVSCASGNSDCIAFPSGGSGGSLSGFPSGLPSTGTYQLSGQVCGTGIGCTALPTESFSDVDPTTLEDDINSAIQSTAAEAGSSGCSESDSFSSWNGSSFTATITITCSSGGSSATVTEDLTVTQTGS